MLMARIGFKRQRRILIVKYVIPNRSEHHWCDLILNWVDHISDDCISYQIASLKLWESFLNFFYSQIASLKLRCVSGLKSKSQFNMLLACIGFRAPAAHFDCRIRDSESARAPAVRFNF